MEADGRPYHHGNLSRALLDAAAELIAEVGPTQMSLREVARRTGVSHAAPVHHFGDKAGLFTALAAEGFELLDAALKETAEAGGSFAEIGVAYVEFAVTHRAHFEVMFRPDLYDPDTPAVKVASLAAAEHLYEPAAEAIPGSVEERDAGVAAWALVHGLATLIINGNLGEAAIADPASLARRVTALLKGAAPSESCTER